MGLRERLQRFIAREQQKAELVDHVEETLAGLGAAIEAGSMKPTTAIEHAYELGWRLAERRSARQLSRILGALRTVVEVTDAAAREMADDENDECIESERFGSERPG